ncbi:MAG: SH3 domain-containing protein [Chloroflexota bacterium]
MFRKLLLFLLLLPLASTAHAQDSGIGWLVTFFNTADLTGPVAGTRNTPFLSVDFNANQSFNPAGVNRNRFSLRAQTQQQFAAGTYTFTASGTDGVRVYVDGNLLINDFASGEFETRTDTIFLDESVHVVSVEFFSDGVGAARVDVNWALEIAPPPPRPGLSLPGAQVATGTMRGAEGLSVRTGPYLGASRIDIIGPGESYPVFARNLDEGEFTWYLISIQESVDATDPETGETTTEFIGVPTIGWVSGRYFLLDVPQEQVPVVSSVFEGLLSPPATGVQGVTTSNLRLRRGPSYRTETLVILDWGADVEILSRTTQARQNHWYQVNHRGTIGWVFAPFVRPLDNVSAVPEY